MTTDRPYRSAMHRSEALAELRQCAGTQFDPQVVAALARRIGAELERHKRTLRPPATMLRRPRTRPESPRTRAILRSPRGCSSVG